MYLRFLLVIVTGLLVAAGHVKGDEKLKGLVQTKAQESIEALIKGEYDKLADLTHSKVVEMLGGREKMIAKLKSDIMKDDGFVLRSGQAGEPMELVKGGTDLFVFVPLTLVMDTPDGRLTDKSYLLGVSGDEGKTWKFINASHRHWEQIKELFPKFPEDLKLPPKEKPVLEKK